MLRENLWGLCLDVVRWGACKTLIISDLRRWQSNFGRLCPAILHSSFCLLHSLGAPAQPRPVLGEVPM